MIFKQSKSLPGVPPRAQEAEMTSTRFASRSSKGWVFATVAAVAIVAASAGARAGTLEETIEAALRTNPDVGVVQADRKAIDQELRQARAQYFPSVDLRAGAGPEYSNSVTTRNRTTRPEDGDASTTLMRWESQLTLTQMLFDGFATQSEVDRQLKRISSAAYRVAETSEFIALDAVEVHLNVLRNQVLVELGRGNLEQHRRLLGQVSELERQGGGSIADVHQAEARVAAAQSVLATAIGNLEDAKALYLSVVGSQAEALAESVAPAYALPESPEAAAGRAAVDSPTVMIANADIEVAKAELQGSRAGYYPSLDLELGTSANDNIDGLKGSSVDAQALLVLRYNLFRGGGDIAREREAFQRINEAQQSLRRAQRDAEQQARVGYNALVTAQSRLEALRARVVAQRETRDTYAQQFDLAQRSLLDLLDSENELFVARSDLTTAEYTEMFAVYRVLAVIGGLLTTLDIDAPKEAIDIYRPRPEPIQETSGAAKP
jgi:outer membrane protein, adhesin transport system